MISLRESVVMKSAPTSRRPVLLIVDDEPGPRESLRFVFKDQFDCIIATCGREGMECARSYQVDIAILDIRMPDMSGVDVLRKLKTEDPDIECVLLTGCETLETARAAIRYGASEYLNKPFDVFDIREVIDRCLARRDGKRCARNRLDSLQQLNKDLSRAISEQSCIATASTPSAGVADQLNNLLTITPSL